MLQQTFDKLNQMKLFGMAQSPKCGNNNQPLDKGAATVIFDRLLSDSADSAIDTSQDVTPNRQELCP